MVKIEAKLNENKEVMKTEKGEVMNKVTLEAGDLFIPMVEKVEPRRIGKSQYDSYTMKAIVKDVNSGKEEELYVNLTKTQWETIEKQKEKLKERLMDVGELTSETLLFRNHLFRVYDYETENSTEPRQSFTYHKDREPQKTFDDFKKVDQEVEEKEEN